MCVCVGGGVVPGAIYVFVGVGVRGIWKKKKKVCGRERERDERRA